MTPITTHPLLCRQHLLLNGLLLQLILRALAGPDFCFEGEVGDLRQRLLGLLREERHLMYHVVTLGMEPSLLCLPLRLLLQLLT